jgi:hypothetical protein
LDPDIIYFLNGNQIAKYNKATQVQTNLGGPPNGDPVTYAAVVVGQDSWVCAAAGSGVQDTYTELYCLNPISPGPSEFIDVYNKQVNGVMQGDPNWPTSAPGQVIGVHDISGGTGANWLEVTFHKQSWGANGGAVLDLGTNTWSLITKPPVSDPSDIYWGGHPVMGNGTYANSAGSIDGRDSRGIVLRNPDNAMDRSQYLFVSQPPDTNNGWCDSDHLSWFNSMTNSNAPILVSRYNANAPNCAFAWTGEIYAAAVDGSNTVWRFAHNHDGGCYYGQGFAQISNDGNWALFSSYWDATLGPDTSFGCETRIDTFIVQLSGGGSSPSFSLAAAPSSVSVAAGSSGTTTIAAAVSGGFSSAVSFSATGQPSGVAISFSPSTLPARGSGAITTTMTVASTVTPGMYNVTVTGTGGGQSHSVIIQLQVLASAMSVQLIVTPSSPSLGQLITLSANVTDPNSNPQLTYTYDWGTGYLTTGPTSQATFSVAGTYTLTVTVRDQYGAVAQSQQTVSIQTVSPSPSAMAVQLVMTPPSPSLRQLITLSANVTDPNSNPQLTYTYDWGTGYVTTGPTSQAIFSIVGAYSVTVTVKDQYGQSGKSELTITFN